MLDCPKEILVGIDTSKWEPETSNNKIYYPLVFPKAYHTIKYGEER